MTPGEIAAFKAGQVAMRDASAQLCVAGRTEFQEKRDDETLRNVKRDYDSMAIAFVHAEFAIRTLPIEEPSDDAPIKGGFDDAD